MKRVLITGMTSWHGWPLSNALTTQLGALSQICLFETKSENRILERQWVTGLNFSAFGNLRQSLVVRMGHPQVRWSVLLMTQHGGRPAQLQGDSEGVKALPLNWVECTKFRVFTEQACTNSRQTPL